jgi:cell division protease FtsH
LGRDFGHVKDYSDTVAARIDSEIHRLVEEAHDEARDILTKYRDKLDLMADRLLEKESLEKEEVSEILAEVAKQSPDNPVERARLRRENRDREEADTEAERTKKGRVPRPSPRPSLGEA